MDGWERRRRKRREGPHDNLLMCWTGRDGGRKRGFGFAKAKWETNRCKVGILEIASSAPDQGGNDARKDECSRLECSIGSGRVRQERKCRQPRALIGMRMDSTQRTV